MKLKRNTVEYLNWDFILLTYVHIRTNTNFVCIKIFEIHPILLLNFFNI